MGEGGATTPKTELEHRPSAKQAVRKSIAATGFPKAKVAKEESGEKAPDVEGPKEQFKNRRFKSRADEEASKNKGGEDVEKPEEEVRSRRKRSGYDEEANKYCNEEDVEKPKERVNIRRKKSRCDEEK